MHEIIQQRIPAGGYSPEEQIDLAMEALLKAARHLEFSGMDELVTALEDSRKPLVLLAAAGVLSAITFNLHDPQGICGAKATLDPYDVSDFEEVDLSRLRLLANSEARGSIEIVCLDSELSEAIVGADWLPMPSAFLEFSQVSTNISGDEIESRQEDNDEYDHSQGWGESAGEGDDIYDQYPPPDRLQN